MARFTHAGFDFHYADNGSGLPVVFQHGLGGSLDGIVDTLGTPDGYRLLTADFRGHGDTRPTAADADFDLDVFARDLLGLADHLGIQRAVFGGISMGAAVALRVAMLEPGRVLGLALSRPALGAQPAAHVEAYEQVASLLRAHGPTEGTRRFAESPVFATVAAESSVAADSLLAQFTEPRAVESVARLERIPRQHPYQDLAALAGIRVPTVVMGQRYDPLHPWQLAVQVAAAIPDAEFWELTPKVVDVARHSSDTRLGITAVADRVRSIEAAAVGGRTG